VAEDVTEQDVLLEIYRQLVTLKRLLIALLVVVVVLGGTSLYTAEQQRSEEKAEALVRCILAGRQDC
jgi:hypothetical protein